ncbi:MAG: hypothetical protein HYV07_15230 [Deltaproteobacteria bacterium]|nr:hypothetical protein [Deltaproteobacteria bacterium]
MEKEPTADSSTPSLNTAHGEVVVTLKRTTVEYYPEVGLFGFVHVERNGVAKVYGQRFPTAADPNPPGWKQIEALTRVSTKSVLDAWSQDGLTNSAATATMDALANFAGTDFRATEVADGERTVVELVPVSAGTASEIVSLRRFLAHEQHGVTELHYQPASGASLTGYFDSEEALLEVIRGCDDGTFSMGLEPRPRSLFEQAPNELRRGVEESKDESIRTLTAVLIHVRSGDVQTVAGGIAKNISGAPPLQAFRGGEAFLLVAVPPATITSETRDDILLRIDQLATQISKLAGEGVAIAVVPELSTRIEVNGLKCVATDRVENRKLGEFLAETWSLPDQLPPRVLELLNKAPNGRLAKLFKGQGKIGIDARGAEIELTGDNYDLAFLKELSKQSKGLLSRDDFAPSVWNRPDGNARQRGKRRLAHLVNDELKRATLPKARELPPRERTAAVSRPDSAPPGLAGALWHMCFEKIDMFGQPTVKKRQGVPLSDKADLVLGVLAYEEARFFHYADTKESSFVLHGAQHTIDFDDPNYDAWFNKVIRLFGKKDTDGKALTAALDTGCRNHPACIKVQRSRWGHFDPEKGIVYLCLDPAQAEMLRVSPAVDGKPIVEVVSNGTDDILLRCPRLRDRAFVYTPGSDLKLFRELVHSQQSLSELDRLASTAFNLACLVPDRVQRPIKHHLGPQSGGKTSAASDLEYQAPIGVVFHSLLVGVQFAPVPRAAGCHESIVIYEGTPHSRLCVVLDDDGPARGDHVPQRLGFVVVGVPPLPSAPF